MKRAILVLGPESSGTRMLTEVFVKHGFWGQYSHHQDMDDLVFTGRPDRIILRRSIPHGEDWVDIRSLVVSMRDAGYEVSCLSILRDRNSTVRSQLKNFHAVSDREAQENIVRAIDHIESSLSSVGCVPCEVCYESFIGSLEYRRGIYDLFALPSRDPEDMVFFDGNAKYWIKAGSESPDVRS